jgi:hypothetical protein
VAPAAVREATVLEAFGSMTDGRCLDMLVGVRIAAHRRRELFMHVRHSMQRQQVSSAAPGLISIFPMAYEPMTRTLETEL